MNLNSRIVDIITYPFKNTINGTEYNQLTRSSNLQKGDLCKRNFIINVTKDIIEIPVFARYQLEDILCNKPHIQKVIIPLYINRGYVKTIKTFDAIIKEFFKNTFYGERLVEIQDGKGNKYYGNSGIIYDSNFNPLLLYTVRIVKKLDNWIMDRYICHVNPIVFENTNIPICKGIINKIIPVCASKNVPFFSDSLTSNKDICKPKIVIDDFSSFFISPITPKVSTEINDKLNNVLNDNIEEIIKMI